MLLCELINPRFLMAPEDEGAGGGDGGAGAGGEGAAGGDDGAGAGAGAGGDGGAGGGGGAAKWFETDKLDAETRDWITAKGYAIDDAAEAAMRAAKGQREAERKLGVGVDQLIQKPKDGQDVAAWLKENGAVFGIPEAPDKYELQKPDMPEGVEWDSTLEQAARTKAHELGLTPAQLQGMTELFAEHTGQTVQSLTQQEKEAETQLRAALAKDWGPQTDAKITMARQAVGAMAEQAGLDSDQLSATLGLLSKETGDAGVMRMFAAIGEAMGEDGIKGFGKGASGMGQTPAEARARLEEIQAPKGELATARQSNDSKAIARLQQEIRTLTQLAAQG